MEHPERLTIAVNGKRLDEVKRTLKGIIRDIGIKSQSYRIYVDEGAKTVIKLIIDEKYAEQLIYEALNNQIQFIGTSEKVRRILSLLALDYDDIENERVEETQKLSETVDEMKEEITSFVNLDSSTIKMSRILNSDNLSDIIDDSTQMVLEGQDIVARATKVIYERTQKEINVALKKSKDNPRNAKKNIVTLKRILFDNDFIKEEFSELPYKAGLNIIALCEKNFILNEELIEIIENKEVDEYLRIKSAIVFVNNVFRKFHSIEEYLDRINFSEIKFIYQQNQSSFDNSEARNLLTVLNRV